MVIPFDYHPRFKKAIQKLKEPFKAKLKKQLKKILMSPTTGKPMRYQRKGTREVYIAPYRLSYAYLEKEKKIIFLDLYHKDQQ